MRKEEESVHTHDMLGIYKNHRRLEETIPNVKSKCSTKPRMCLTKVGETVLAPSSSRQLKHRMPTMM